MKPLVIILVLVVVFIVLGAYFWQSRTRTSVSRSSNEASATANINTNSKTMELNSVSFINNANIPVKYTCDGENINPEFSIKGVPEAAKSLAFIMNDPDASSGTFTHWTMWNIKPGTKEISENSVPEGAVQGLNGAGANIYTGPCPPSGVHRYFFKFYALDVELNLDKNTKADQLVAAMEPHIIDQAELMGRYGR